MSKQREALELALEALQWNWGGEPLPTKELEGINAIREALAEPEQEPMATITGWYGGHPVIEPIDGWIPAVGTVLYTAPPARKPLTDEQIDAEFDRETWVTVVFADGARGIALDRVTARDFARAIERAHGIGEA